MCGRYASARSADDLIAEFDVDELAIEEALPPDYNVAPTDPVHVVLERPARPAAPERGLPERKLPTRQLRVARWGLVPSWASDPKIGARMINARVETVVQKPAFRTAAARRRCLVPADGYYEWYADEGTKRPHFLHRADGKGLAFAGLYEIWRDQKAADEAGGWMWSCSIVTTEATDDLGHVHDRMPMVVPTDRLATWLDTGLTDAARACELLLPAGSEGLVTYPVAKDVGDVRNNGPHLIEPLRSTAADDDDVPMLF
ncbi:MAG: SOS response-associated peptidase [Streptosporangiales bacterium]|nr:SOS response-associated peptidase [Streptosporangiales bacterium]